jgi:hypothetical protein
MIGLVMLGNFKKGFEKKAGVGSEVAGTVIMPLNTAGILAGLITGARSEKEQDEAEERGPMNFIPGVGGYNLGRRMMTNGARSKEERLKMHELAALTQKQQSNAEEQG